MTESEVGVTEVRGADLGRNDWLKLMWGFCWRTVCVTAVGVIIAVIVSFIVGMVAGLFLAAAKKPVENYALHLKVAGGVIGMVVGFLMYQPLIKWLLRSAFGDLRLKIVRVTQPVTTTNAPTLP